MLDNLKNHIEDQREEFEIYPFDTEKGWSEISSSITPKKEWTVRRMIGVAACFLLVVLGSIYQLVPQSPANSELSEMEQYYNGEINQKITLVRNQLSDDSILRDLETMDQAFAELKKDLNDNVDNEEVVAAMMENYQLKLQILEEILKKLEKEKS